ncbi:MAG TPA: TetR/AcrR family transcriptional regulator [Rhizomicrobium sp.]|nr:TetR/AcrR family transcriptional regulator [Rhizomicrobium sp.]
MAEAGLAERSRIAADGTGTRERILDCAANLYSRHGYGEGSVRNIAAAIGIRGPSLYHHFASKEEITLELFRIAAHTASAELDAVTARAAEMDGEALLDAAIAAHLRALFHPRRYLSALLRIYREVPQELRAEATRELTPYLRAWMRILNRVGGKGRRNSAVTEIQVFFVFGAINSIEEWHYGHRAERFSLDDLRDILRNMLLHGFASGRG